MATHLGRKVALVINGSPDPEHLDNVERSIAALGKDGYKIFVASTTEPSQINSIDRFVKANSVTAVAGLIQDLQQGRHGITALSENDELVIYGVGHSSDSRGGVGFCFGTDCNKPSERIFKLLDSLKFGRRVAVFQHCFSGANARLFLDDPHSLFIASTSTNQISSMGELGHYFWSPDVEDGNKDGTISFQERYAHYRGHSNDKSFPLYLASPGFKSGGRPVFETTAHTVTTKSAFDRQLKRLRPGQYAFVMFSAHHCGICPEKKPLFEMQAYQAGGEYLFITAHDEANQKALSSHYPEINSFPTYVIFDHTGRMHIVPLGDGSNVVGSLREFHIPMGERVAHLRNELLQESTDTDHVASNYVYLVAKLPPAERYQELERIEKIYGDDSNTYDIKCRFINAYIMIIRRVGIDEFWKNIGRVRTKAVQAGEKLDWDLYDTLIREIHKIVQRLQEQKNWVGVQYHMEKLYGEANFCMGEIAAGRGNTSLAHALARVLQSMKPATIHRMAETLQRYLKSANAKVRRGAAYAVIGLGTRYHTCDTKVYDEAYDIVLGSMEAEARNPAWIEFTHAYAPMARTTNQDGFVSCVRPWLNDSNAAIKDLAALLLLKFTNRADSQSHLRDAILFLNGNAIVKHAAIGCLLRRVDTLSADQIREVLMALTLHMDQPIAQALYLQLISRATIATVIAETKNLAPVLKQFTHSWPSKQDVLLAFAERLRSSLVETHETDVIMPAYLEVYKKLTPANQQREQYDLRNTLQTVSVAVRYWVMVQFN